MHKHFNFKAGGLVREDPLLLTATEFKSQEFTPPPYWDMRPACIEASNQGAYPHCAGYATAGYQEVHNYRKTWIKKQIDGDLIYAEAKKIDGNNQPGTSLSSAAKGAQNAGIIDPSLNIRTIFNLKDVQLALLRHDVVIAGFNTTKDWNSVDMDTGYIDDVNNKELGGHAVLICWFHPTKGIGWANSWGLEWGVNGFGRMKNRQFDEQFLYAIVLEAA